MPLLGLTLPGRPLGRPDVFWYEVIVLHFESLEERREFWLSWRTVE